jgi:hypothetical protein
MAQTNTLRIYGVLADGSASPNFENSISYIDGVRRNEPPGTLPDRSSIAFLTSANVTIKGHSPLRAGVLLLRAKILLDPAAHEGAHLCGID